MPASDTTATRSPRSSRASTSRTAPASVWSFTTSDGLGHGLVARVQCEQEVIGVAHHGRALEIAEPLQALRRLRASLRVVA